jgi:hypothetical protein
MKRFLLLLLLAASPLLAQKSGPGLLADAVRAYNGGDYESATSLFQAVLATDPKNQAAQNYLRMIQTQQKAGSSLSAALKKIILPKVEFQEASAREAFDYVVQQVQKQSGGKQNLNLVWMVPEDAEKKVTLSLQNIPAFEALRYIGEASDLEIQYDTFAVKVRPAPPATAAAQ